MHKTPKNKTKKRFKVKCFVCKREHNVGIYKKRRNKNHFCCKEHYSEFQASNDNPHKGKKRILSNSARNKMRESALKNLQTKESQRKSALARKGMKLSESHKYNIRANARYGWKNHSWKGRYASYAALHIWAKKHKVGPKICEDRNDKEKCKGRIELSNKDHKYYKRIADWSWRCTSHHRKYDKQHGLIYPTGSIKRIFDSFGNTQKRMFTVSGIIADI